MALLALDSFDVYKVTGPLVPAGIDAVLAQQLFARWNNSLFTSIGCTPNGYTGNGLLIGPNCQLFRTLPYRNRMMIGWHGYVNNSAYPLIQIFQGGSQLFEVGYNGPQTRLQVVPFGSAAICDMPAPVPSVFYFWELDFTLSGSGHTHLVVTVNAFKQWAADGSGVINSMSGTGTAVYFVDQLSVGSAVTNRHVFLACNSPIDNYYCLDDLGPVNNSLWGPVQIYPLLPNGDVLNNFTPDSGSVNYTRVNDNPFDADVSYTKGTVVGQKEIFDWQNAPAGKNILGIQHTSFVRRDGEATVPYKHVVGDSGGELSSDRYYPPSTYGAIITPYDINPATGVRYKSSDFNVKRFGGEMAT